MNPARIIIIDDDEIMRQHLMMELAEIDSFKSVRIFETLFDAADMPCDLLLLDMSSVVPMGCSMHSAYSPIAKYHELHPGVVVVLYSPMGKKYLQEVFNTIRERCPSSRDL